jgi:hypothetical protein
VPPFGRYILAVLTVLSLLLCAATIAMWSLGHHITLSALRTVEGWNPEGWVFVQSNTIAFASSDGIVVLFEDLPESHRRPGQRWARYGVWKYLRQPTESPYWDGATAYKRIAGFRYLLDVAPQCVQRWFTVPYWFMFIVTGALPVVRLRATMRRSSRRKGGRCETCGYDLRATPDRCPECGRLPKKST